MNLKFLFSTFFIHLQTTSSTREPSSSVYTYFGVTYTTYFRNLNPTAVEDMEPITATPVLSEVPELMSTVAPIFTRTPSMYASYDL